MILQETFRNETLAFNTRAETRLRFKGVWLNLLKGVVAVPEFGPSYVFLRVLEKHLFHIQYWIGAISVQNKIDLTVRYHRATRKCFCTKGFKRCLTIDPAIDLKYGSNKIAILKGLFERNV